MGVFRANIKGKFCSVKRKFFSVNAKCGAAKMMDCVLDLKNRIYLHTHVWLLIIIIDGVPTKRFGN